MVAVGSGGGITESTRKPGWAYSEPYTFTWIAASFESLSARWRISGMSGSMPLAANSLVHVRELVVLLLKPLLAPAATVMLLPPLEGTASDFLDDAVGTISWTASSSTARFTRFFIRLLSGESGRKWESVQLVASLSRLLSGECTGSGR